MVVTMEADGWSEKWSYWRWEGHNTKWITHVDVEVTQNNGRIWNWEKDCELSSKALDK